ncbi:hypothetical protein BQ8794_10323 [Mesorhizobium prunaredense]|uniref:Uncharacterized protein n=1 Tax=Mesorhizobium prunaredense TaxID=1631249 RepID=A0A1R3V3H8_9HYPH|nr:hypothetical protein BQ8794_10323 [Mesorhizobium prunaredense]
MSEAVKLPISPLVGEMPGRAEGGAVERRRRETIHERALLAHYNARHRPAAGLDPAYRHRSRRS